MEGLRLGEEEDLEFHEGVEEEAQAEQSLCLVGRFLTDRSIRVPTMKDRMAEVWRPGRGVKIDEIEDGLFAFQFWHQLDIQKVLQHGPWSFDKHILVLGVVQQGMQPQDVPLNHVPFWVQVHGVPVGFMSETVGRSLANFIGEFLEYDVNNTSNFWRPYMRIRVMVDVREPLKRSKRIKKQGGEAKIVTFKYERLEMFCYICGKMGHAENGCELRFTMGVDDGVRGWGPELRVENRRAGGGGGRSKYLRDGKGEWVNPTLNARRELGSNGRGNNDNSMQREFQKSSNEERGEASNGGGNKEDKANDGGNKYHNSADFFKNPQRYFPVKLISEETPKKSAENKGDEEMGDAIVVENERKKRQRAHMIEEEAEVSCTADLPSDGVGSTVGDALDSLARGPGNGQQNQSFLSVGLGKQACQEQ